jgi:hypothetical protein
MKLILSVLMCLLSIISFGQSIINWEPEITVADGTMYGNIRPRIAITANDLPVVLFGKGPNGILYSTRMNGGVFGTPVALLPSTVATYLEYWTGPDIAAKGDTVIAVFKAMPVDGGKIYSVRSVDGGITFSDTIRVDSHDQGVAWMPSMGIDENGNPTVTYMAHDAMGMNPSYNIVHSTDQGLTYQAEMDVTISIPNEACDCCPAEYVINGSQHALLFRNNNVNIRDVFAVYSDDDGATFPQNINIDQLNWSVTSCPSTGPHGIFNNDKLLTVYASRADGKYRVYLSETATSPLLAFETRTMMTPPTNTNGIQNYPRITGKNDTLIMVWQESESSNPEIFSAITTTGSISDMVSSKTIVNSTVASAQTNPDIIYANGIAHVVYQDASTGDVMYRKGIIGTLSTEELDHTELTIYPNPSESGTYYINASDYVNTRYYLTDAVGNLCDFTMSLDDNKVVLQLKDNAQGIFLFTIVQKGVQKTHKLISQ